MNADNGGVAQALLFDFDGTILDTETTVLTAWREEYEHHGLSLDEAAWLAALGGDEDRYSALAERAGPAFDLNTSRQRKRAREAELVAELALRDGVEECLRQARSASMGVGLVSSSPVTWVRPHLERLGLLDSFDVVVTREDATRSKPSPDLYLTALAQLGVEAGEAIAIEDSANGVTAAKAAGIRCIAFPNPVTMRQDLTHAHVVVVSDLWAQVVALAKM